MLWTVVRLKSLFCWEISGLIAPEHSWAAPDTSSDLGHSRRPLNQPRATDPRTVRCECAQAVGAQHPFSNECIRWSFSIGKFSEEQGERLRNYWDMGGIKIRLRVLMMLEASLSSLLPGHSSAKYLVSWIAWTWHLRMEIWVWICELE